MRIHSSTRYAAFAALVGALACAGNKLKTDETGAARDTTTVSDSTIVSDSASLRDTLGRDTTLAPTGQPSDTFQQQGAGAVQDTAGYSGVQRDSTGVQPDTSSLGRDSTGGIPGDTSAMDTTGMNPSSSGVTGVDSASVNAGDTTGYNPTQQSRDTTSR